MELLSNNQKSLFENMKSVLFEESAPKYKHRLKMNLQHFAEGDDEGDDSDDDGDDSTDDEEDELSLDELMKDPKFKKQYQRKLKEQLNKRMKKFDGVDPEEYRQLKEKADKKKQKDQDEEDDEAESLKGELTEKEKKLARAEKKLKRSAVKEFAMEEGYDHKLLARLINLDEVEMDEDDEPMNLEELFEEVQSEFPQYFGASSDDEEDEDEENYAQQKKKKRSSYQAGSNQKLNKKKKVDDYQAGVLAYQNLVQKGKIKSRNREE